ncbi:hypothetical protein ABZT06_46670 [Streptomyces sp. NPDC005483]|uniref:hypothetical protein n=1 Tax=Streptomyces sp. NPDC005483 TaxID=3154882 RepID=UPI0033B9375E
MPINFEELIVTDSTGTSLQRGGRSTPADSSTDRPGMAPLAEPANPTDLPVRARNVWVRSTRSGPAHNGRVKRKENNGISRTEILDPDHRRGLRTPPEPASGST